MLLDSIHSREDLLHLSREEDEQLCREIRSFLVNNLSQTGGHLASNLGIVEITLAIHKVFDTAKDRLVFDVGHQSYVHKILTGRMGRFSTLRQLDGLAGFPKPAESEHDAFVAGHASNAVSVALGMARARTLHKEHYNVIALLGDGALTGGLVYEGLNNAGTSREPMIVILNDNGMSITPNVGGISRYLRKIRSTPGYFGLKLWYRRITDRIPGGKILHRITHKIKSRLHQKLLGKTLFEDMGFTYLGPVDGHDTEKVSELLRVSAELQEPVLLHLITKKGKGFQPAEKTPQAFHGVGRFDPVSGRSLAPKSTTFSQIFGAELLNLAREDERICAITAAMQHGTGLDAFAKELPKRYFDVGIAEGHAVSMAAGMAAQGMIPVFAVYSTFLQRSFDMLLHDVSLMKLHVVFAVDHSGLVGADGETHHGCFDAGYLRLVPGMNVLCPSSFEELKRMLRIAVEDMKGPVAVRYPVGGEGTYTGCTTAPVLQEGSDCTVVCYGPLVNSVLAADALCVRGGISAEIIKLPMIAPLDMRAIMQSVQKTGHLLVVEDTMDSCCVAKDIFSELHQAGICVPCSRRNLGAAVPPHGSVTKLLERAGLDGEGIYRSILEVLGREE